MPDAKNMNDYREYIKKLPYEMSIEYIGLPCNAEKINIINNNY